MSLQLRIIIENKNRLLLIVLLCIQQFSFAQLKYITIADGDYDDCLSWIPTCPPDPIPLGDSVFVDHIITLAGDVSIEGVLVISATGELNGDEKIEIETSGTLINNGNIDITDELHNDGSWYNNNYARVEKVHNDGYVCNTDTIEIDSDEKFDNHGGTLECGGFLIACEIRMRDNGSDDPELSSVDICCEDGSDPEIDYDEGDIDSSSVSICGLFLDGSGGLPVELVYFNAMVVDREVYLKWITKSELNNDYFIVSRSNDGINYSEIGTIDGSGNSVSTLNYSFIDERPLNGISYYKLTQVDFNGDRSKDKIRTVFLSPIDQVFIYPNPFVDRVNLNLVSDANSTITVRFYNALGQLAYEYNSIVDVGTNIIPMDLQELNSGMYFVQIIDPFNYLFELKLIKN